MLLPRWYASILSLSVVFSVPAAAQSILSTHAGVIHYFEGLVAVNGKPLQPQFGRFPEVPDSAELRTAQGRAEILLGPGVMLRVAEDTALKMVSTELADTRLELITGSAILQAKEPLPGNSVTVTYKDWQVSVAKKGVYRIDTTPPQIRVYDGEVSVQTVGGTPAVAKAGQTLPLANVLVPEQTLGAPGDGFNEWAFNRSEAVAADNATAAQIVDDPALYPSLADASGLSLAGYTYFPPTLGNPYMSYGSFYSPNYGLRNFGVWAPYGSGFGYGGLGGYGAYGYGAYGYGYGGAPLLTFPGRPLLPALPIRQPTRMPTFGTGTGSVYHPPTSSFPTVRPGIGAMPGASRPVASPAAPHVGRR
ncbi:MAG TPA: hypothetical protein VG456_27925 [Candidatus Sulfopaludibacter sp.]|jgi:hypothetical protein|nr:hypothetical protein [Candidatus Sulfopaludibacter sp.]